MTDISKSKVEDLLQKVLEIKESLKVENKKEILKSLEKESNSKDIWNNPTYAQDLLTQIADIRKEITDIDNLEKELNSLLNLISDTPEDEQDLLADEYNRLEKEISKLEFYKFLSGKYDSFNASLSIHSGQGGTEANDWAEMLFRMYTMYIERKGWKYSIINILKGQEVGISTVTIEIYGRYAYGLLKKEHGIHRLVRLSPFNAQNLRQTSFASVEVIPILDDTVKDIEIPEKDIEFKATTAGGPGGQNVNKTSSAVQITHIPTGITVHCSQERSQLQNRTKAMQILKGKLWKILEENRTEEIKNIKGDYKLAGWGNQIRNYILHPYKLVKDLRTGIEISTPQDVLDGNLDELLEAQLRIQ